MADYAKIAGNVERMLEKFGAPAALRRADDSDYDPEQGNVPDVADVDEPIMAVVFDYDERVVDGSLIQIGDKKALVACVGVPKPRVTDKFVWQDDVYTIVTPMEIAPAGLAVLFELQVRK